MITDARIDSLALRVFRHEPNPGETPEERRFCANLAKDIAAIEEFGGSVDLSAIDTTEL